MIWNTLNPKTKASPPNHHEAHRKPVNFSDAHAAAIAIAPPTKAVSPDSARKIVARSIIERITLSCSAASSRVVMRVLCHTKPLLGKREARRSENPAKTKWKRHELRHLRAGPPQPP